MTKKRETKADKVYKELAATGKYVNTGKVLIGVMHKPKPKEMTQDEETIQSILLGSYRPMFCITEIAYVALLVILFATLFISCKQ
jgi:hypothetical protein